LSLLVETHCWNIPKLLLEDVLLKEEQNALNKERDVFLRNFFRPWDSQKMRQARIDAIFKNQNFQYFFITEPNAKTKAKRNKRKKFFLGEVSKEKKKLSLKLNRNKKRKYFKVENPKVKASCWIPKEAPQAPRVEKK